MELVYFILGMLIVLWINSTYQTFQTNKTNKNIQGKLDIMETYVTDTSKHYFQLSDTTMESMAKISSKLESIQEQLDAEDLNTTIANIKEQMTTLERNIEAETKALVFANKSTEHNFNKTFNDIQALRNALNKMGQDPNLMSRY
jgi:uncharacterized protein YxjI